MTVSAQSNEEKVSNLTEYDEFTLSGTIDIESDNVEVSEVLSFEEMAKVLAEDFDISIEEAKEELLASSSTSLSDKGEIQALSTVDVVQPLATKQYAHFTSYIRVTNTYVPTLRYYAEVDTYPGSSFRAIKELLKVNLNRGDYRDQNISHTFSGEVYTHLQNANRIFFIVNGDFYKNGTMSYNATLGLPIGGEKAIGFSVSGSTSHYRYHYQDWTRRKSCSLLLSPF